MSNLTKAKTAKLISIIEDIIDRKAVSTTDFTKGRDFEKVMQNLYTEKERKAKMISNTFRMRVGG